MRAFALVFVAAASACTFDASLPVDTHLSCTKNSDCPSPLVCGASGQCRDPHANAAPTVAVGAIARSVDVAHVPLVVADADGDAVTLSAVLTLADNSKQPVTLTPAHVAATAAGVDVDATFDPRTVGVSASAFSDAFVLTVAVDDGKAKGESSSKTFAYGNTPPSIASVDVDNVVVGLTALHIHVSDAQSDTVALSALELSLDGAFDDTLSIPLDTSDFPLGIPTNVATSSDAVDVGVAWNSVAAAPGDSDTAVLRATFTDSFGAASAPVTSASFHIHNTNLPPTVTLITAPNASDVVAGDVSITVDIEDPESDHCLLSVAYSVDGSAPQPAASNSATADLGPGQHTFVWQSTQLGFDRFDNVTLSISVTDGNGHDFTTPVTTAAFSVDNRGVVNAPPSVIVAPVVPAPGERFLTDVVVPFTVADPNGGDTADITLEFSTDFDPSSGTGTFFPCTPAQNAIALSGLATSLQGADYAFLWDARADLPTTQVDTDGDAATDSTVLAPQPFVVVRAQATDNHGLLGPSFPSTPFQLGDRAPVVSVRPLSSTVAGLVPIEVTIHDEAPSDVADLDVQFCAGASACASGQFANAFIALGQSTGLSTSVTGQTYVVVWDTLASPQLDPTQPQGIGLATIANVDVRVRAKDSPTQGSVIFGAFADAGTVRVLNQTPPRVEPVTVKSDGGLHNGAIPITYRLVDEQQDNADVLVEFSRDEGVTFSPCTEMTSLRSEGTQGLATDTTQNGGVVHTFVWDSTSDLFAPSPSTLVRITAADAFAGAGSPVEVLRQQPAGPSTDDPITTTFQTRIDIANFQPGKTAVADLNGDGLPDLIGGFEFSSAGPGGAIDVRLAHATSGAFDGTFTTPAGMPIATSDDVRGIAVADVTCDGKLDIIAVTQNGFNQGTPELIVVPGNGNGTFGTPQRITIQPSGVSIAVGDIDRDGKLDVVVGFAAQQNGVQAFHATGAAPACTLTAQTPLNLTTSNGISVSLADIDGDGFPEIVTAGETLENTSAPGSIAFGPPTKYATGKFLAAVADVDGDGDNDIVTLTNEGFADSHLQAFLNDGTGAFTASALAPVGAEPEAITLGDISGDGIVDAIVPAFESESADIVHGSGDGTFAVAFALPAGLQPNDVALADFNNDGVLDVGLDDRSGPYRIFLAQPAPALTASDFAPASVDAVGRTPFAFGNRNAPPADLDEDGAADLVATSAQNFHYVVAHGDQLGREPVATWLNVATTNFSASAIVAIADVNGDGALDFIEKNNSVTPQKLDVLLGGGALAPGFTQGASVNLPEQSFSTAVGDFNNDGILDVVTGGFTKLAVFFGTGDAQGTFTAGPVTDVTAIVNGEPVSGLDVADLDGDGVLDVVYGVSNGAKIVAMKNNGAGAFTSTLFTFNDTVTFISPAAMRTGDLDGDGIVDFASLSFLTATTARIDLFKGGGSNGKNNGTFTHLASTIAINARPANLEIEDLTGDGIPDLVATGTTRELYFVMKGTGNFTYQAPLELTPAGTSTSVSSAVDVNGDGAPDLFGVVDGGFSVATTIRPDPRDTWLRLLNGANTRGAVIDASRDLFGHAVTRNFSQRKFARIADDGAGDVRRPDVAFAPDFVDELRRTSIVQPRTAGLVPLTSAWRASGDVALVAARDPLGAVRLEARARYGARTSPTSTSDFSRAGLDVTQGRGVVVDLPFLAGRAPGASVRVFGRHVDFERADEVLSDPLASDPAAHRFLPVTANGRNIVRERASYVELGRAPNDDVTQCTTSCFAVDATRKRVRVLTDAFGAFEAFNAF